MVWNSIPTSDSPPELRQSFKSAALTAAVARREQASDALRVASADARSLAAAADADSGACSSTISPPATGSAGPQRRPKRPLWHPQPLPKPKATDSVVVLKPRTQASLADAFPENGAGRALIAHIGATATRLVTVVMLREQNHILVYTSHLHIAYKLIGKFAVPSLAGPVPLFGYLRADTQDSCNGVGTVGSADTEAALREGLYWPEGEILHVRRLGTSNKVRLTFSGKVKPSRTKKLCQHAVGAALLDIDPAPVPAPNETFAASAERRCLSRMAPVCSVCWFPRHRGPELYRTLKGAATQAVHSSIGRSSRPQEAKTSMPTEAARVAQAPATKSDPTPRPGAVAIGPSRKGQTPDGPPAKKPNAGQASPAPSKPTQPSPELKPTAQGDSSWAARIRQGSQIVEALANRSSSPNSTLFGQVPEAMDSSPFEHRDTAAHFRPLEARLSSLEAQMASIGTMIHGLLPAALQTIFDRIPGKIAAQMSQLTVSTHRPKLKRGFCSQAPWHLSRVAEVDEQSNSSTATSEVSTGSSSGASMAPFALVGAPHTFSSNDGGQRP
ncbi:hypothetical protein HPB48_019206 [Haemaphysalis longicornis]|uniref:Uncharacterized protein n=1 Tax=Haemaphysalis longicornis TaxID=44386 RepID=A0A9J6GRJ9_HAELO|nr:hypothetical protein HPB48_019206 [Haemaphysalis longicornis]